MSQKGTSFDGPDDERLPALVKRMSKDEQRVWVNEYNKTWTVVETCDDCGEKLIAGEQTQHHIDHIEKGDARVLCGMYARANPEIQQLFREWLTEYGS